MPIFGVKKSIFSPFLCVLEFCVRKSHSTRKKFFLCEKEIFLCDKKGDPKKYSQGGANFAPSGAYFIFLLRHLFPKILPKNNWYIDIGRRT